MSSKNPRRTGPAVKALLQTVEALEQRMLFTVGSPYSATPNPEISTSINPGWKFSLYTSGSTSAIAATNFNDSAWTPVTLPQTWDAVSTNTPTGDGWYRQALTVPASMNGDEIYLQFQGASLTAAVYVDGTLVGTHNGGWEAFDVDVTTQMTAGSHLVAVDVNNVASSSVVPAGGGDYTKEGGLYRSVSLLGVSKAHVALTEPVISPDTSGNLVAGSGVYFSNSAVTMGIGSATINVTTVLDNSAAASMPLTVTSFLVDAAGIIQAQQSASLTLGVSQKSASIVQTSSVANPHLWNGLIDPYLYDLYVQVTNTSTGQLVDLNHQQVGIRSFSLNANTGFFLNGSPYKLDGVNLHQDSGVPGLNGSIAGWAQTTAQEQNDINLALTTGATMIRTAHYQRDPAFYSYCDQKGLIIETEFGLNGTITSTTAGSAFVNICDDMLTELIRQNYDHPSIVFWSLYNEIGSSTNNGNLIASLSSLAHTLDTTGRYTMGESNQFNAADTINTAVDAVAYHPYNGWYGGNPATDHTALATIHAATSAPVGVGEWGAGSSYYQYSSINTIPDPSTVSVYHPQTDQTAISEAQYADISSQSYLMDTLVWSMFDFSSSGASSGQPRYEGDTQGINDKGLMTRDRQNYKDIYYFYKANWNLPVSSRGYNTAPVIWISDHNWTDRDGSSTVPVTVFSNVGAPTLSLNGSSPVTLSPQSLDGLTIPDAYSTSIVLAPGANTIVVSGTANGHAYTNSAVWTYHAQALAGTPLAKVEFTNTIGNVQSGYLPDTGQAYGAQPGGTYGWTDLNNNPNANTSGTYDRTTTTTAPYNILSAQTGIILNPTNEWQYQLPDGEYDVQIVASDSLTSGIVNNLLVNGVTLHANGISNNATNSQDTYQSFNGTYQAFYTTVIVTNGRLTITGGPGMVLANGNNGNEGNGSSSAPNLTQGRLSSITINTIENSPPTVVTAAAASPSSVSATSTNLSVSAGDTIAGESALIYTWVTTGTPPAPVNFSANGTNAAKHSTATFTAAGTYNLQATILNPADGLSTTSSVVVTVTQTLTSIAVAPTSSSILDGQTNQFSATAFDQFGVALVSQPPFTWSVDAGGAGTVNSTGLYAAPAAGPASDTVRATSGSVYGATTSTVILSVINGTSASDSISLIRAGANLLVYIDSSTAIYTVPFAGLGAVTVAGGAGADVINIDFSGGAPPVPAGGILVDGSNGIDTLIVTGTSGGDTATVSANAISLNGSTITCNNIASIIINGNGGTDSLDQLAQPANAASLAFNGGTGGGPSSNDTLNISNGSFTFAASTAGAGAVPLPLAALSIGTSASVFVSSAAAFADRWVLALGSLTLSGTASRLDLGSNDMIVRSPASLSTITGELQAGQTLIGGIGSTAARNDATHLTTLGVMQSSTATLFDHQAISAGDLIVKYTYFGDANLDGKVDGSDYSLIDNGFLSHAARWSSGDFNYDNVINGSDYTLIDNAFNRQGATITAGVAVRSMAGVNELSQTLPANASQGQTLIVLPQRRRPAPAPLIPEQDVLDALSLR